MRDKKKTVISITLFWYYLNSNIWTADIESPLVKWTLEKRRELNWSTFFEGSVISLFLIRWNIWWQTPQEIFWGKRGYLTDNLYPQLVNQMQRMCQVVFHMFSAMSGWQLDVIGCEWKYWRAHVHELSLSSYRINKKGVFVGLNFTQLFLSKLKVYAA